MSKVFYHRTRIRLMLWRLSLQRRFSGYRDKLNHWFKHYGIKALAISSLVCLLVATVLFWYWKLPVEGENAAHSGGVPAPNWYVAGWDDPLQYPGSRVTEAEASAPSTPPVSSQGTEQTAEAKKVTPEPASKHETDDEAILVAGRPMDNPQSLEGALEGIPGEDKSPSPEALLLESPAMSVISPLPSAAIKLLHPLESPAILTPYLMGVKSVTMGDWRTHYAVDFRASPGAVVRAAAAGTSKIVAPDPYWGNLLELDHGQGWVSQYANLSEIELRSGDWVEAGQVLGVISANPPLELLDPLHLHFVLLYNGLPQDPEPYWQP